VRCVSTPHVIEVANELFQFCWSFDLLSEPKMLRWDKVVTFYDQHARKKIPVLGEDGKPTTDVAGIIYLTGKVTVELKSKAYVHADVGRCVFSGNTPEALDMAIAGAATDCLKRCFRHLGDQFGLTLYDKEIARTAGLENGSSSDSNPARSKPQDQPVTPPIPSRNSPTLPPVTTNQPEVLQYRDGAALFMNNPTEGTAFTRLPKVCCLLENGSRLMV